MKHLLALLLFNEVIVVIVQFITHHRAHMYILILLCLVGCVNFVQPTILNPVLGLASAKPVSTLPLWSHGMLHFGSFLQSPFALRDYLQFY